MSPASALAPDAAIVLGMASTAMPFARSREDAVERWLRVLRSNGRSGAVLRALGVSEAAGAPRPELLGGDHSSPEPGLGSVALGEPPSDGDGATERHDGPADIDRVQTGDAVAQVAERAAAIARERGTGAIATTDVLMAVMEVYGAEFDRVLQAHGTDRAELTARLLGD